MVSLHKLSASNLEMLTNFQDLDYLPSGASEAKENTKSGDEAYNHACIATNRHHSFFSFMDQVVDQPIYYGWGG